MVIAGWKSIAATLGVSVRTAQTLRVKVGLPVVNLSPRLVAADRERLREWVLARPCATSAGEAVAGSVT